MEKLIGFCLTCKVMEWLHFHEKKYPHFAGKMRSRQPIIIMLNFALLWGCGNKFLFCLIIAASDCYLLDNLLSLHHEFNVNDFWRTFSAV